MIVKHRPDRPSFNSNSRTAIIFPLQEIFIFRLRETEILSNISPSNTTLGDSTWPILELDSSSFLPGESNPLQRLAEAEIPAIIFRNAFNREACHSLVADLIAEGLMFVSDDVRIEEKAIPVDRVDRWTKQGLNPAKSRRRRIDIGTSLGNLGDDKEHFLQHSAETHRLFSRFFAQRENPIKLLYRCLQELAPTKQVVTAYEPDGQEYGPAIIRVHYGGYTYGPHFDSVRQRENRSAYAVHKYLHQFAGVLCIQNATRDGQSAQAILHRQLWNPTIDPLLKNGGFHDHAASNRIDSCRVELEPGDLYFFNTGCIHEVPGVEGDLPRIVLATFIGYSPDEDEIMVWS